MINKESRIEVFDCPIDNLTMEQTIHRIEELIKSGEPHQHVVVNVDKLVKMHRDNKLKGIIESCDLINVDGKPVVWASRLVGKPLKERVSGFSLMQNLVAVSAKKGYRLYFLGARNDVVHKVVRHYQEQFPKLKVAGFHHGYWRAEEEDQMIENIAGSNADILFVALSSPKKELFIREYLQEFNVPFVMGVGGAFDVIAGKVNKAPLWMEHAGLTWFWRFLQEPRRMWKRYFIRDLAFFPLIIREFLKSFENRK